MKNWVYLIILLPLLSSCSYISKQSFLTHRDRQYLSARSIPPLSIPPGISTTKPFINKYPVPARNYPESAKQVSIVPPGI